MSDKKNGKIIKFPTERRKKERPIDRPDNPKVKQESKSSPDWMPTNMQSKVVLSGLLGSVLFLVALANFTVLENQSNNEVTRGIASVDTRNTAWDLSTAESLSKPVRRELASLGHTPNIQEKVRYGILGGKYDFVRKSGQLVEISLQDGVSEPVVISNRLAFLSKAEKLMPVPFTKSITKSRTAEGSNFVETVELFGSNDKKLGEAIFLMDPSDRLISLKIKR